MSASAADSTFLVYVLKIEPVKKKKSRQYGKYVAAVSNWLASLSAESGNSGKQHARLGPKLTKSSQEQL